MAARRRPPCARRTRRSGSRANFIQVIGYLPDHVVMTGFRVTPVVAFVRPGFELKLDAREVEDTFEVPLDHVFDPANHRLRLRRSGFTGEEVQFKDIPFGERNIWGATAGMLLTLYRLCIEGPAVKEDASEALVRLLALMARLRDPRDGCPWDLKQTFATIAPYTIEEAYEVADAIDAGDPEHLRDELGDLLFQVVFHARMAEERGWFDFAAVASAIRDKLERRHPHIFAGANLAAEDLVRVWEEQKAQERAQSAARRARRARSSPGYPRHCRRSAARRSSASARRGSASTGRRRVTCAPRCSRSWPRSTRHCSRHRAGSRRWLPQAVTEEIGDLLFSVANWSRHLEVDPEEALRAASAKFERRFARMEQLAQERHLRAERACPRRSGMRCGARRN